VVIKRRFSAVGTEVRMVGEPSGSGCDVEVTHVAVGSIEAWSLAFAAFGSSEARSTALRASWRTMTQSAALPAALLRGLGWSMGYPEWLAGRHASAYAHEGGRR
jgi:hypothetical protein